MLHHHSPSRSAEAPLAGGDGATPPPVASSAAARPPRAAATLYDDAFPDGNGPVERQAAEDWFFDQLDVIDCHAFDMLDALGDEGLIRRWVAHTTADERAEQTDAVLQNWRGFRPAAPIAPVASTTASAPERRLKDERPIFTSAMTPEDWAIDPYPGSADDIAAASLAVWTMATIAAAVLAAFVVTLLAYGGLL